MPRWTVKLEGGPRRVNHSAIAAGHKVYSFGGYCTGEDYEHTKPIDVHILNTVSLRWQLLPPVAKEDEPNVPYQRYGHTAVNYNDCAYIWGGRNDTDGACSVLFCFDTDTYTWSRPTVHGDLPPARDGHSACVIAHKMYIFGGYEEVSDLFSDRIFTLNFTNFCWTYVRTKGVPANWRDFHTASAIGSKMFIFGGRSDEGGEMFTSREIYCNKMHVYDTVTNSWSMPPSPSPPEVMPIGRRSHSTFEYNGCLYVFGGYNGLEDRHFSDVYKYDPETRLWSIVLAKGQGPSARRRQCCCVVGSKVYLFGGTSPRQAQLEHSGTSDFRQEMGVASDLVDHADLHVLDFNPSLKTLCLLVVIEHKLDRGLLPHDIRWELEAMTKNNTISRALTNG